MPWKFTDATKTAVTDGRTTIPLGVKSGMSRNMDKLIAAGLEIGEPDIVPTITPSPYTLEDVISALVKDGTLKGK